MTKIKSVLISWLPISLVASILCVLVYGPNKLTWQPQRGVRIAAVVVRFSGSLSGYILAGRSMTEGERLISKFFYFAFGAWILSLSSSLVLIILLNFLKGT